jgi:hypothetical protein
MVFHYKIRGGPCLNEHSSITLSSSDITCYVGEDKHENEFLIKYGWPGDVWFHVDSLSSAHVYFRVTTDAAPVKGIPMDDLPVDSVYDMMQIVKHNSISGCKLASTKIVYTPHSNLKKTSTMESGTVTFHDTKLCRYGRCDKDRKRVKELENTKTERVNVDFYEEMKGNERRIIERKKFEKLQRRDEEDVGLYDPIADDQRTTKIRATRQGGEDSGLDFALAALEGVSYAALPAPADATTDADGTEPTIKGNAPIWIHEANSRSLEDNPDIRFLRARGYDSLEAADAVNRCGSRIVALQSLWRAHATDTDMASLASDSTIIAEAAEVRQEEREVLQAIFGEDDGVVFSDDETLFDAIFPISSYEPPARYELPPRLLLEIFVDNGIAPQYPMNEPPVLALVGGGLPEALLKELTNRLRVDALERSKEEPGDPQIFNLLALVAEEAEKIVEEETAELKLKKKIQAEEEAEQYKKAQAERRKEQAGPLPSDSTAFKSEQERRSYAKDVMSKANCLPVDDNKTKKEGGEKFFDTTGVSDKDLINDLFG